MQADRPQPASESHVCMQNLQACIVRLGTQHPSQGRPSVRILGGPAGVVGESRPALKVFNKEGKIPKKGSFIEKHLSLVTLEISPEGWESPSEMPSPPPLLIDALLSRHRREAQQALTPGRPYRHHPKPCKAALGTQDKASRCQPANQPPCASPAATGLYQAKSIDL